MLSKYLIIHNDNQGHSVLTCLPESSAPDCRDLEEGGAAGGEQTWSAAWHSTDEHGVN